MIYYTMGFGQKGTQNTPVNFQSKRFLKSACNNTTGNIVCNHKLMTSDKQSYQHYYDLLEFNASAGFTGYWHGSSLYK